MTSCNRYYYIYNSILKNSSNRKELNTFSYNSLIMKWFVRETFEDRFGFEHPVKMLIYVQLKMKTKLCFSVLVLSYEHEILELGYPACVTTMSEIETMCSNYVMCQVHLLLSSSPVISSVASRHLVFYISTRDLIA